MKKLALFMGILAFVITFSTCSGKPGKTGNVVITLDESRKFSEEEVESAVDCVLEKFKDFEGCELQKLWYDEERSNAEVDDRGSEEENIIVLFSEFYVGHIGVDPGFSTDSNYTEWMWVIMRDSKTDSWSVVSWGY
ncbi:MAG: hypothetical protein ACK5LL_09275 [Suipraeoptans sp.]